VQENVVGFEIAVDDGGDVESGDGRADLAEILGCFNFGDGGWGFLEVLTEMSVESALFYDVTVQKIIEEAIDFNDIGMVRIKLNLNLSDQLFKHVAFLDRPFGHDLDCADNPADLLNSKYHLSEGAVT
jgi:hypothetical protein